MKKKFYQRTIELTNGPATSKIISRFAQSGKSRWMIPNYINTYKIDVGDIENPLADFRSLHDFFIRSLKKESRPAADAQVVSPVDGKIEIAGDLHDDIRFIVKNQPYSLGELLGNEQLAEHYSNGKYAVLYLSPADYHRIHSPADGEVLRQYTLGKKSYPVNSMGLMYGKSPISGNYRMISELDTSFGRMLVVKVGAMFINSIKLTNISSTWKKGEEAAYFSFGSTVVLFFEEGQIEFAEKVRDGERIKVGEALSNML